MGTRGLPERACVSRIKGFALDRLFEWYAAEYGDVRLRGILVAIPEELREPLDLERHAFGVLASAWYPAPLVHRILDDIERGHSAEEHAALVHGAAEAIVRTSLRGIYKMLSTLFMTPERYAQRAQTLWDRYYGDGVVEKTIDGATTHGSVIRDWAGHHPTLCELNAISGRIIYEELGCENVNVERTSCVSMGGGYCAQRITWDG